MAATSRDILRHIFRALVSLILGIFYIFSVMAGAMLAARGEGSGEGMMGGLFGLVTSPLVMAGVWFLFPRRAFRITFCLMAAGGLVLCGVSAVLMFNHFVSHPASP